MLRCLLCSAELPDGGSHCPACGAPITQEPTRLYDPAAPEHGFLIKGRSAPLSGGTASPRFGAGRILAGRYRIVALLGQGGMGEVYRAEDLKLGQPVALKFLPRELASDPYRLSYFHNEVRLARQVSHPHVCRVYDIGEIDGQPFLSMEYVDGEDLANLLRRVGRLSEDKGLEVAQQLCLGLAAAHDQTILHRDLKPANVMIDGKGQVRITDFGLARLAGQRPDDVNAGTPEYMAPEQFAGGEATVQSDVYGLGLVLYEVFTGRQALRRLSVADGDRPASTHVPVRPTAYVPELDPAIERVILRCLEIDPATRPRTARQVAAALPGGDPLAAALAAGETPSPELVAAAGERGTLHAGVGLLCLALTLLGLALVTWLSQWTSILGRAPLEMKPDALENRAVETLRELGHGAVPEDSAAAFGYNLDYARWVEQTNLLPDRWDQLSGKDRPSSVYFWYRQSPRPLVPATFFVPQGNGQNWSSHGRVTLRDPPPLVAGMASVRLDPRGRLLEMQVVPPQIAGAGVSEEPDWERPFALAGLDYRQFTPAEPLRSPPAYADRTRAWVARGVYPGLPEVEVRVEAAAYRGRVIYFAVVAPWTRPEREAPPTLFSPQAWGDTVLVGLNLLLLVGGAALAWRNLRLGRVDRRGGWRLGLAVLLAMAAAWLLSLHHVAALAEVDLWMTGLAHSLFIAAQLVLIYLALEPYVRRIWPETIISWSRLMAGRGRDPRVGRDVLIGALCGVAFVAVEQLNDLAPQWLGLPPSMPSYTSVNTLLGNRFCAAELLLVAVAGLRVGLLYGLLFFLLLRVVLRNQWLASGVYLAFHMVFCSLYSGHPYIAWIFYGVNFTVVVFLLTRYGLVAIVTLWVVRNLLIVFPLSANVLQWQASSGLVALAAVAALALVGYVLSRSPRPVFREDLLGGA